MGNSTKFIIITRATWKTPIQTSHYKLNEECLTSDRNCEGNFSRSEWVKIPLAIGESRKLAAWRVGSLGVNGYLRNFFLSPWLMLFQIDETFNSGEGNDGRRMTGRAISEAAGRNVSAKKLKVQLLTLKQLRIIIATRFKKLSV